MTPTDPFAQDPNSADNCPSEVESARLVPVPTPAASCDTPQEVPAEIFQPRPLAPRIAPLPVASPPIWSVPSPPVLLRCTDFPLTLGPVGEPSEVAAGDFTSPVRTDRLPAISASQGVWLRRLAPDVVATIVAEGTSAEYIKLHTRLTNAQVDALLVMIDEARALAYDRAYNQARRQLSCFYLSPAAEVFCPDGALLADNIAALPDGTPVVNPAQIPAGQFQDPRSFAAAQSLAERAARDALRCVYGNEEVTVTCVDIGFAEEVPTDVDPLPLLDRRRIGSITVPANTVFSLTDSADATDRALAFARSELDCFYINELIVLNCAESDDLPGYGPAGKWDGTQNPDATEPADASLGETGSPVTVPAGAISSEVSSVDAQATALVLAVQSLDCYWASAPQTVTCPDYDMGDGLLPASPRSPARTITVPAGVEESRLSQADADDAATQFAILQLQCLYCNVEIPPVCIPQSVRDRVDYELPLPAEWVTSDWSADATLGLPADTYCSEDATQPQGLAQLVADTLAVTVKPGCRYINDEIRVGCSAIAALGVEGSFPETERDVLSPLSYPNPQAVAEEERFIRVEAGSFSVYVVTDADVPAFIEPGEELSVRAKAYANFLGRQQAIGLLDCFYDSDATTLTCVSEFGDLGHDPGLSHSPVSSILGAYTSRESKDNANEKARQMLLLQLECLFKSPAIELYCYPGINSDNPPLPPYKGISNTDAHVYGTGYADSRSLPGTNAGLVSAIAIGSLERPVRLDAGIGVSSVSQAEATRQALAYGILNLDCFWTNPTMRLHCGSRDLKVYPTIYNYPPTDAPADGYDTTNGVLTVQIEQHEWISYSGLREAMIKAFNAGQAQLVCLPPLPDLWQSVGCQALTRAQIPEQFGSLDDAFASGFRAAVDSSTGDIYYHSGREGWRICERGGGDGGGGGEDPVPPVVGGGPGAPGPTGASSGCEGSCHGFYA